MKKLSTIIMALALVLGMSQCKKQETPTTGNTTPIYPGVDITVKVGDNEGKAENGEKHHIAPNYGLFAFSDGDKLYVGHGGKFVGTLKFKNGFFSGTINPNPNVTEQPLHFFFLGNSELKSDTIVNQTSSLSISIADQSENLPVLSYGASTKPFTGTGTTYSTTLKNKCALVRFNLQNEGSYEVTLSNVPTLATVNFANPTDETAIKATEGQTNANMTLYGEEGNSAIRWAILLPGTNLSPSVHTDLTWNGEGVLPVMGNNTYINSGLSINNTLPLPDPPASAYAVKTSGGTLTQFSVSANKKVYFSRGNLKASFSTNSYADGWSFHNTQFDEIDGPFAVNGLGQTEFHHQYSKTNCNNPVNENGIIFSSGKSSGDRFTWGYFDKIKLTTSEYLNVNENLTKTAAVAKDWGCVFTESSPEGGNWRTLSADEWIYLFNDATNVRGDKRFLRVKLLNYRVPDDGGTGESYYGVFVFPDHYTGSGLSVSYSFNSVTGKPAEIEYSNADVQTMLNAGAVFLPCVGYRYKERYYDYLPYMWEMYIGGGIGYYWSSSCTANNPSKAKALKIVDQAGISVGSTPPTYTTPQVSIENLNREYGYCVRLVWDAN